MLGNLFAKINLFGRIKTYLDANPQKAKFIGIIALALIVPLTVVAALTVQNLKQRASEGSMINISDQNGNRLFSTIDPNVYIDLNLNTAPEWILPNQSSSFNIKNKLATKAYATSAGCTPPYDGFQGCFNTENADPPAGYFCAGSCTTVTGELGQYCYTSTKVGNKCSDNSGASGICNIYGNCEVSASAPTLTPTRIPTSTPPPAYNPPPYIPPTSTPIPSIVPSSSPTPAPNILRAIYIENKDTDGSTGGSAPIKITVNNSADITHIIWRLNDLLPGQTQAPQTIQVTLIGDNLAVPFANTINLIRPTSPTNILSNVNLSLFDCSKQMQIGQECHMSALAYDTANSPTYKDVDYTWGISSSLSSIGTLNKTNGNITSFYAQNVGTGSIWVLAQQGNTQVQKSIIIQVGTAAKSATLKQFPSPEINTAPTINADLNRDGVVNCKDTKILISQFGQKGANLSVDLNRDGIVDGIDYNTIIRNYTPGDTTVCFQ